MFEAAEWIGNTKYISYNDYKNNGLCPTIEMGEKYCDVIYTQRILKKT